MIQFRRAPQGHRDRNLRQLPRIPEIVGHGGGGAGDDDDLSSVSSFNRSGLARGTHGLVVCPVAECLREFTNDRGLAAHIRTQHRAAVIGGWGHCPNCQDPVQNGSLGHHVARKGCGRRLEQNPFEDHNGEEVNGAAAGGQMIQGDQGDRIRVRMPRNFQAAGEIGEQPQFQFQDPIPGIPPDRSAELRVFFCGKLLYLHHSWRGLFAAIVRNLLRGIREDEDEQSLINKTLALFIFPGLVLRMHQHKGILQRSPVEHLRDLSEAHDHAAAIIGLAALCKRRIQAGGELTRQPRTQLDLQKRVVGLAQAGLLSAAAVAVDQLQDAIEREGHQLRPVEALTEGQVREHLAAYHPAASVRDVIPVAEPNEVALTLEEGDIRGALLSLKVNSGAGFSGWTNKVIRGVASSGSAEEQGQFVQHLTAVFNKLLGGSLPDGVKALWTDSRSALIPKDVPGSYRPIGVGECLYRLAARAAHRKVGAEVGSRLQPIQLGSGVSGGVEIAALATDLGLKRNLLDHDFGPGFATLSLDVRNAFNSVRRRLIYDGLVSHCPALIPFFRWRYGEETVLRWHNGAEVGRCATGCTQGDPLATLFFSVAVDSLYRELSDVLKEEERQLFFRERGIDELDQLAANELRLLESSSGAVIAIVDDVSISGRVESVFRTAERVAGVYERYELHLNIDKCWILTGGRHDELVPPAGFVVREDGGKVLGRPIGSPAYQRTWVARKTSAPLPHLALSRIPCRVQLELIRSVYDTKFDYLAKVVSPEVADDALRVYDGEIERALWNLQATPSRADLHTLRTLPFHLGGLSVPLLVGPRGTRNRLVSRTRTAEWLQFNLPHLYAVFNNQVVQQRMFGVIEAPLAEADEDLGLGAAWTPLEEVRRATKEAVENAEANSFQALHLELKQSGREAHAARLLSAKVKGSAKWMTCSWGPGTQSAFFRDEVFREALRCRLLGSFSDPGIHRGLQQCGCPGVDLAVAPCHPGICRSTRGLNIRRHDGIRDRLFRFLKAAHPTATVVLEPTNLPLLGEGRELERRPDISFALEGRTCFIDVAVVDPAAQRHLEYGPAPSATTEGGAALQEEESKRALYAGTRYEDDLVPFVLESTGRLGQSAREFLERFDHPNPPTRRSALLADLSSILAIKLGEMSTSLRSRLRRVRWLA